MSLFKKKEVKLELGERYLEVGELPRIDRGAAFDQAPREPQLTRGVRAQCRHHVVAIEKEHHEGIRVRVAPDDNLMLRGGHAVDLQIDVELVGPEPRQWLVRDIGSECGAGGGNALLLRVLPGLQ